MVTRLHPGVYITEVPGGLRSIEDAPTSITIFVGETERGPLGPTKITSRSEYERLFGGYFRRRDTSSPPAGPRRVLTAYAIDGFFANGGSVAYVVRAMDDAEDAEPARRDSVIASAPGVWANDSVRVAFLASRGTDASRFRIAVVYDSPQPGDGRRLVGVWDGLSVDPDDTTYVVDVLQGSMFIRWDTSSVPPVAPTLDEIGSPPSTSPSDDDLLADDGTVTLGEASVEAGNSASPTTRCCSPRVSRVSTTPDSWWRPAMPSSTTPPTTPVMSTRSWHTPTVGLDSTCSSSVTCRRSAARAPPRSPRRARWMRSTTSARAPSPGSTGPTWWSATSPGSVPTRPSRCPPSACVAGVFARTDEQRGVWKAPAGTEAALLVTVDIEHRLEDQHCGELNSVGVHALRSIPGVGRVVWGSRTMQPSGEWRHVPVRRTAIFLRTSVYNGIQWAVFEPNDEALWSRLRDSIGGFMETQFRRGAFAGRTSDQAYW